MSSTHTLSDVIRGAVENGFGLVSAGGAAILAAIADIPEDVRPVVIGLAALIAREVVHETARFLARRRLSRQLPLKRTRRSRVSKPEGDGPNANQKP